MTWRAERSSADASHSAERAAVVEAGSSLFGRGYAHGSAGNISLRVSSGYLVTPTDASLGHLDPERLAQLDHRLGLVSGDRPSKTIALHHHIYRADPTAGAVVHTHATHLVALSLLGVPRGDIMPPLTPYQVMKVGHVPLVPYHRPGDPVVGDLVVEAMQRWQAVERPIRAVLLERLGPVVWGPNLNDAMVTLEELEETAKVWLLTSRAPEPLSPSAISELRDAFAARW